MLCSQEFLSLKDASYQAPANSQTKVNYIHYYSLFSYCWRGNETLKYTKAITEDVRRGRDFVDVVKKTKLRG